MLKSNLTTLLLGVALFTGISAVNLSAEGMKCGAAKSEDAKKIPQMKCGAGKCGTAMKATKMKCGAGKCGAAMKTAKTKCGAKKCGAKKCGTK